MVAESPISLFPQLAFCILHRIRGHTGTDLGDPHPSPGPLMFPLGTVVWHVLPWGLMHSPPLE